MVYSQQNSEKSTEYLTIGSLAIGTPKLTQKWFDEFLASRRQGISPRTLEFYRDCLRKAVGIDLTEKGINKWLTNLKVGNAKANHYTAIKALCNWLYKTKRITKNPIELVDKPKTSKRILPVVTKSQLSVLVINANNSRDQCIIKLLYDSGCRLSEVANIKDTDFDWKKSQVSVIGKGNRQRMSPFTKSTGKALKDWFDNHSTFEINASGIQTMLVRLEKKTGIKCNPHAFRRGFAIQQLKNGKSTRIVQQLSGWESLAMVERYSQQLTQEDALEQYDYDN